MEIKLFRTSKDNPLERMSPVDFKNTKNNAKAVLKIELDKVQNNFMGFGGALTPASLETFALLSEKQQEEFLSANFSEDGLNYNLIRITMSSCDFSSYTYDYLSNQKDLSKFDLSIEDRTISCINRIKKMVGDDLFVLSSTWGAPAFMKDNKDLCHGGHLLEKYKPMWAEYFIKYLIGMQKKGLVIDAVSIQNEPEAVQTWESMLYSGKEEKEFAKKYLIPALKKNNLKTKIVIWDHNKDHIYDRAVDILKDDKFMQEEVFAVGYHWYCSNEFENLDKVHNEFKNQHLLFTEGCVEVSNSYIDATMFDFRNGETYGRNYILGLNHYTEGFFDWNILLNEIGGPNHVKNYCEAPIMFNRKTKQLIYNISYYYIKHLSKFIKKGSKILCAKLTQIKDVYSVSAINKNNEIVCAIQNEGNKGVDIRVEVEKEKIYLNLPAHSIQTLLIKK